jgi:hypothetical protein
VSKCIDLLAGTRNPPTPVDRFYASHHSGEISRDRLVRAVRVRAKYEGRARRGTRGQTKHSARDRVLAGIALDKDALDDFIECGSSITLSARDRFGYLTLRETQGA